MFYKDERLALFIDGSNLYAAAKSLGFDIDYKLLRQEFVRRGRLLRANYYTALLENDELPLMRWNWHRVWITSSFSLAMEISALWSNICNVRAYGSLSYRPSAANRQ